MALWAVFVWVCVCVCEWERQVWSGWCARPGSARLGPGSWPLECSTVVARTHTFRYMNAQIDLQYCGSLWANSQRERERNTVGKHKHTHHTHTEQLLLFATAAGDSDNMCFVPYVYVSVHVCTNTCIHTVHKHTPDISCRIWSSVVSTLFFPFKKKCFHWHSHVRFEGS